MLPVLASFRFVSKNDSKTEGENKAEDKNKTKSKKNPGDISAPTVKSTNAASDAATVKDTNKTKGKNGSKDMFAPSVKSTYAAGDAAIAMAALYGDKTDGDGAMNRLNIVNIENKYDSSLKLDKEPEIRQGLFETWFPYIFPPQEFQTKFVEPVIFGTDTSLGLKIAWSTVPTPFPDSFRFGFNRTEIGLAPVTMFEKDGEFNIKMASLLATVDADVAIESTEEGADLNLDYMQYFATGKAATLLALQEKVRKAMLERLDPAATHYANKFAEAIKGRSRTAFISSLVQIQTILKNTKDQRAIVLADRMDNVESLVPETYELTQYQWNPIPDAPPDQPKNELKPTPPDTQIIGSKLAKAVTYWNTLQESVIALESARASTEFMYLGHIASPQERSDLASSYEKITKRFEEYDQRLLSHPDIVAAFQYLFELLN